MGKRGFEKIAKYAAIQVQLPERKTKFAAGYDFYLPEDVILPPGKVTLVPTGIKAYMQQDEYLGIHIRSGIAVKKRLTLINNQGIIDADYYNNPDNEGHIQLPVYNLSSEAVTLNKGERIAQGIFYTYRLTDNDAGEAKETRGGGFGSTK